MPPYILCPQCERVPVTRYGELCEECAKKVAAQDEKYKQRLNALEQKPISARRWLSWWLK